MLLWLWRKIVGAPYVPPCQHAYVLHERVVLTGPLSGGGIGAYGVVYVNRCTKCGQMSTHRIGS